MSTSISDKKLHSIEHREHSNIIELSDIEFRYSPDGPVVLDIEELIIKKGEKVSVIGPSGSGKTTLLRMINGYIQPDSGYLNIFGEKFGPNSVRPKELNRKIGFIFQHFNLIDRANVYENVLWGRLGMVNTVTSLVGWFNKEDKRAAVDAISDVDLTEQLEQRADKLSGGQLQRVAIARVIAQEPEIILADEPVSSLDPVLAEDVLSLLSEICDKYGVTLLMNLHQPVLAKKFADRIIGMREGKVVYDDRADLIDEDVLDSIFGEDTGELILNELKTDSKSVSWKVVS